MASGGDSRYTRWAEAPTSMSDLGRVRTPTCAGKNRISSNPEFAAGGWKIRTSAMILRTSVGNHPELLCHPLVGERVLRFKD